MRRISSFTLIELLIVVGILAVLVASIVVILNPTQLLAQARDAKRLADTVALNKAMGVLQAIQPPISLGTASTVYISIPDTSATCTNLGLPSLPSGWVYSCVSSTNPQKSDGTGWIPVNFNIAGGALLPTLPADPVNATTSNNFYAYTPQANGIWEVSVPLESTKYIPQGSTDGGTNSVRYENGNNLTLLQSTVFGMTPVLPDVQTLPAAVICAIAATLYGSVNPHNISTTAWFEYGTSPTLFSYSTAGQNVTGNVSSSVSTLVGNLYPTTWYVRIKAQNQFGSSYGSILNFVPGGMVCPD
ncbi:MAG: prepilin-type N-terminal cleavage/methylation domain-containing protein [Candidatus Paceibacterota bacterium]|jgi:type II secretory pathway pseudopilin PulG